MVLLAPKRKEEDNEEDHSIPLIHDDVHQLINREKHDVTRESQTVEVTIVTIVVLEKSPG